jgi:heat shock protein HslJ
MRTRLATLPAVLSVLLLGACTGAGGAPTSGPADPPRGASARHGLDDRTFLSVDVVGRTLVSGSQVRLSFQGGQVSASAGCNTMGGPYAIDADRLIVPQLATTEMACAPALMDQDSWLADLLGGATVALVGDTLTISEDGITLTLLDREVADPDRPLAGTRWVVDGLVSGDAVSSLPAGITAALTFTGGRVRVEAGCNTGAGGVAARDGTLVFEPIALTMMACEGPAMDVERAVLAVLAGEVTYAIEAGTLRLDTGALGLVLRAAP